MFNWTVSAMDYNVSQDGHTNVVTTVHWRCSKEDGDNSGSSYGTVGLEAPGDEQVAAVEAAIDAQIAEQVSPTSGTGVSW